MASAPTNLEMKISFAFHKIIIIIITQNLHCAGGICVRSMEHRRYSPLGKSTSVISVVRCTVLLFASSHSSRKP